MSQSVRLKCLFATAPLLACCGTDSGAPSKGASDASGRVILTLASDQATPSSLVVSGSTVFWNTFDVDDAGSIGRILSVSRDGGTPATITVGQAPAFLTSTSSRLYWSDPGASDVGAVLASSLSGGDLVTLASGQTGVRGVAVDSASVYWIDTDDTVAGGPIAKVPLGGGTPTTLVPQAGGFQLLSDSASVYWVNLHTGTLLKTALDGGPPTTLVDAGGASVTSPGISVFALDSTSVYWAWVTPAEGMAGGTLLKVPTTGGAVVTLATGLISPNGIAVDGMNVYWTDAGDVRRVGVGGGQVTTIASGQDGPCGIALDDDSVYWTNLGTNGSGSVMKATPK